MDVDLPNIEINISKHLDNTNNIFGVHLRYLLENIYKSSVFLFILIILYILSCITGVSEVDLTADELITAVRNVNSSADNHITATLGLDETPDPGTNVLITADNNTEATKTTEVTKADYYNQLANNMGTLTLDGVSANLTRDDWMNLSKENKEKYWDDDLLSTYKASQKRIRTHMTVISDALYKAQGDSLTKATEEQYTSALADEITNKIRIDFWNNRIMDLTGSTIGLIILGIFIFYIRKCLKQYAAYITLEEILRDPKRLKILNWMLKLTGTLLLAGSILTAFLEMNKSNDTNDSANIQEIMFVWFETAGTGIFLILFAYFLNRLQ